MVLKSKTILMILFLILLSYCSQSDWQGSIKQVDGVTVVENPRQGLWEKQGDVAVKLIRRGEIGKLEGEDNYLFARITDVAIDKNGDVFVADGQSAEIRKFNQSGEYIHTIGRKGEGPGEFRNISVMAVNSLDQLIVFDNMAQRISIFSREGEFVKSTKLNIVNAWVDPAAIISVNDNFLLFGKIGDELDLFHEFDRNWTKIKSFGKYQFINNKEFEENQLGFLAGRIYYQPDNTILYTKYFFDNQIFIYQNNNLTKIIKQDSGIKNPYEVKTLHDVKKAVAMQREQKYDFYSFGGGIAFVGYVYQSSAGIFRLNDGKIVHFLTRRLSQGKHEFGVSLYDEAGKFLIYQKLGENLYYNFRCKDNQDNFYVIDNTEYPKVLKLKLEL